MINEIKSNWKKYLTELIITIVGVYIAFALTKYQTSRDEDGKTKSKLLAMFIQMQYNIDDLQNLIRIYSDSNVSKIDFRKFDESNIKSVIQDENIFHVLTEGKISFIRSYLQSIEFYNLYSGVYVSSLYENKFGDEETQDYYRQYIRNLAVSILAHIIVLQDEFSEYEINRVFYDRSIKDLEEKLNKTERNILEGKLKINEWKDTVK